MVKKRGKLIENFVNPVGCKDFSLFQKIWIKIIINKKSLSQHAYASLPCREDFQWPGHNHQLQQPEKKKKKKKTITDTPEEKR